MLESIKCLGGVGLVILFVAEQTGLFSSGFVDHPVQTGICPFNNILLRSGYICNLGAVSLNALERLISSSSI